MYIKQVIIQGFKSYRDQTVIEPFDPRHNVVVGRNGSGKSNFFYAVQFVLSNEFYPLRADQREAILNEGKRPRAMSAWVEITFDNRDGRLPIETKEVYLRREIGAKKDNYFLNKKNITRPDLTKILESAGFAVHHPFYIVKQGEINRMATAQDSARLKLLREVAGTQTYDERKEESVTILRDTEAKIGKIVDFLKIMDERLAALEGEKDELRDYQRYDRQRRGIEYEIYERELAANKRKLADVRSSRVTCGAVQASLIVEVENLRENLRETGERAKRLEKELQKSNEDRDVLGTELQRYLEESSKLTLTKNDLLEDSKNNEKTEKIVKQELEELLDKIHDISEELATIKLEHESARLTEDESSRRLAVNEQKRRDLYVKEGRVLQFGSKEDRDNWIEKELRQIDKLINDKESHRTKLHEDLERVTINRAELVAEIEKFRIDVEAQITSITMYEEESRKINEAKSRWEEKKRIKYRQESELQQNLASLKDDLARANHKLRSMIGKQITNGRDSIRKILDKFRKLPEMSQSVETYCGQVIENFDCDETYHKAVEVTAGTRLFNHIVENDELSTKILKEMNEQKLPGDLTFMPLNRLRVGKQIYPPQAKSMISCLKYNPKYEPALMYIFGKTLICPDLPTATDLARDSGLDCITLDGDQVSCKGSMTGGYFNNIRSRLEIQKTISELGTQVRNLEEKLMIMRNEIKDYDCEIISLVMEIQKIDTKIGRASDIVENSEARINLLNEDLENATRYLTKTRESIETCVTSLNAMNDTRASLEHELQQDLVDQLSKSDQEQIVNLTNDIRILTEQHKDAFSLRVKREREKNELENLLKNNLLRRQVALFEKLCELSSTERMRKLNDCETRLGKINVKLAKIEKETSEQREKMIIATKSQKFALSRMEKLRKKEKETLDRIEADAKDLEKLASRENLLEDSIVELTRKITELGTLPSAEARGKFVAMTSKQLFSELERANDNIKKFSHVNKRALDQFTTFSEEKEKLSRRKDELDRADIKIKELMHELDDCKYETLSFTFKEVSKYFVDVFGKLVPCGRGELVMKTSRNDVFENSETATLEERDHFVGVGIRVSFDGQTATMKEMNQLSGGQKSLVALALIFAIQKTDPVPFYLFDEIDQALDAEHRNAVASMINELSSGAQFITTTFKPELLQYANKFYGVKYANHVSHIESITKDEAADFVTNDDANDE